MAITQFGATFGAGGAASLRDLYMNYTQDERANKRLLYDREQQKKKEDTQNSLFLNRAFDPTKYGTGNPQSKEISDLLTEYRNRYSEMLKSGMSRVEVSSMIYEDMNKINSYLQQAKVFDPISKKYASEYGKYGFSPNEIDAAIRKHVLFDFDEKTGEYKPKPIDKIDWDVTGAMDKILSSDGLTVNATAANKHIANRKLRTDSFEVYNANTPKSGWGTMSREKGTASFDPFFDEIQKDEKGVVTGIYKKTVVFHSEDGTPYVNKETGKNADPVITEDAFDFVYNGSVSKKYEIDQKVRKKVKELEEKGIEVDDNDKDYYRRVFATEDLRKHSATRFLGEKGLRLTWRNPPAPKAPKEPKEVETIDLSVAPKTQSGGYSIMGQSGDLNLGKNNKTGRDVTTSDIIFYPDGSMEIEYYNRDKYGNAIGDPVRQKLTKNNAKTFLKNIEGFSGNKATIKKIKALSGEEETPAPPPTEPDVKPTGKGNTSANLGAGKGVVKQPPKKVETKKVNTKPPVVKKETPKADTTGVNKKTGKKRTLKINYNKN